MANKRSLVSQSLGGCKHKHRAATKRIQATLPCVARLHMPKERLSRSDGLYRSPLHIQNIERAARRIVIEHSDH
jgi:hypothetical protein